MTVCVGILSLATILFHKTDSAHAYPKFAYAKIISETISFRPAVAILFDAVMLSRVVLDVAHHIQTQVRINGEIISNQRQPKLFKRRKKKQKKTNGFEIFWLHIDKRKCANEEDRTTSVLMNLAWATNSRSIRTQIRRHIAEHLSHTSSCYLFRARIPRYTSHFAAIMTTYNVFSDQVSAHQQPATVNIRSQCIHTVAALQAMRRIWSSKGHGRENETTPVFFLNNQYAKKKINEYATRDGEYIFYTHLYVWNVCHILYSIYSVHWWTYWYEEEERYSRTSQFSRVVDGRI